jgi:hypothetical protein
LPKDEDEEEDEEEGEEEEDDDDDDAEHRPYKKIRVVRDDADLDSFFCCCLTRSTVQAKKEVFQIPTTRSGLRPRRVTTAEVRLLLGRRVMFVSC